VNLKEQVRYLGQRWEVFWRTEACTSSRVAPEPQNSWTDWTKMDRRMRSFAASSEGSLTMQNGDWGVVSYMFVLLQVVVDKAACEEDMKYIGPTSSEYEMTSRSMPSITARAWISGRRKVS